jgi:hypothetical protein
MKPTKDTELHDRLTKMFNTAESTWEWSSSKKVADKRRDKFINHLLTTLEEWGYHKEERK